MTLRLVKFTLVLTLATGFSAAVAADREDMIECTNTVVSSVQNLWKADDMHMHCEAKNHRCEIIGEKETHSFEFAKKPNKIEKAVDMGVSAKKMTIKHHYVKFKKEGMFDGEQFVDIQVTDRGVFPKALDAANKAEAKEVTLAASKGDHAEKTLMQQIEGNLKLIGSNLAKGSFPPGMTKVQYIEACKIRLSGCDDLTEVESLKPLFAGVKECM